MELFSRRKKTTISNTSLKDLRSEEIMLKSKRKRLSQEINKLESENIKILNSASGGSKIKRKILKTEFKQKQTEAQLKTKYFEKLNKKINFINNLIALKHMEKDLQDTKFWDKIKDLDQDDLERHLADITIDIESNNEVIDELNSIIENTFDDSDDSFKEKDDFDKYVELIESGEMTPEEVNDALSKKEKKDEELE